MYISNICIFHCLAVGGACIMVPSLAIINKRFEKRKGLAMSISSLGSGIFSIVAPLLTYFFIEYYGFTSAMCLIGAAAMHCCVAAMVIGYVETVSRLPTDDVENHVKSATKDYRDKDLQIKPMGSTWSDCKQTDDQTVPDLNKRVEVKITELEKHRKPSKLRSVCTSICNNMCRPVLFRDISFTALYFINVGYGATHCITSALLPALVIDQGLTEVQGAMLLACYGAADSGVKLIVGFIMDIQILSPHKAHILNTFNLLSAVGTVLTPCVSSFRYHVIICIAQGLGGGVVISQRPNVAADIVSPKHYGQAIGQILMAFSFGAFAVRIIGGN